MDILTRSSASGYIEGLSITGLASNPTIFDHAIKNSAAYDPAITQKTRQGVSDEALFFEPIRKYQQILSSNCFAPLLQA
jgi:transaldolase